MERNRIVFHFYMDARVQCARILILFNISQGHLWVQLTSLFNINKHFQDCWFFLNFFLNHVCHLYSKNCWPYLIDAGRTSLSSSICMGPIYTISYQSSAFVLLSQSTVCAQNSCKIYIGSLPWCYISSYLDDWPACNIDNSL